MCFTWFEIFNNYLNENCINFLYIWKYNISFFKFNLYIFNNKFYCFILVYLVWIFHFWWVSGNLICTRTWFLNIYRYTMDYFKYVIYNIYNFDTVTFYFYVFLCNLFISWFIFIDTTFYGCIYNCDLPETWILINDINITLMFTWMRTLVASCIVDKIFLPFLFINVEIMRRNLGHGTFIQ